MRELKGEKDLQLAKDVLCAFEEVHYPNAQACSDTQNHLYWFEAEDEYYSMDAGFCLRGETEEVRILELEEGDEWITHITGPWELTAFVNFRDKHYLFYV